MSSAFVFDAEWPRRFAEFTADASQRERSRD